MPQLFHGCADPTVPVKTMFEVPVEARYVRVNPRSWYNEISLRLDIIGCGDSHSKVKPTTPTYFVSNLKIFWSKLF